MRSPSLPRFGLHRTAGDHGGRGAPGSGVVYASLGYGVVSLLGGSMMAVALALSTWWTLGRKSSPLAAAD